MKLGANSEPEIKLIGREIVVNAASAVGIRQAWLLENQALKTCLAEKHPELTHLWINMLMLYGAVTFSLKRPRMP